MTYQNYEQIVNSNTLVQCFTGSKTILDSVGESRRIITWKKPRLAKFITIYTCGGGGGGGMGATGSSSAGGGGGGGSAGSTFLFIPAFHLPDILYLSPGYGGKGGATGATTGSQGGYTLVSINNKPFSSYSSHIIFNNPGQGGTSSGAGGAGGAFPLYNFCYTGGLRSIRVGLQGRNGSNTSNISYDFASNSFLTYGVNHAYTLFCGPGAGGGNLGNPVLSTPYDGGSIILGNYIKNRTGSAANSALQGSNGLNYELDLSIGIPKNRGINTPIFFTGGAGGGAGTTVNGGSGGHGGYGSGGGGGGAAITGKTAGDGGDGGPGLIIIISTL